MKQLHTTFASFSSMALSRGEMKMIMGGVDEAETEFGNSCVDKVCHKGDEAAGCKSVNTKLGVFCTCKIQKGTGC